MADRDLINKPLPLVVPEEHNADKRGIPAPVLGKLGVQTRAREVGTEADAPAVRTPQDDAPEVGAKGGKGARPAAQRPSSSAASQTQEPQPKAFRAAYFNRDVQATQAPNLRAKPMAALRGEGGATDLKKVVLPPPSMGEAPRPEQLGAALERMEPAQQGAPDLPHLLALHNAWTQAPGMTMEKLQARQAELEAMVEARKQALARMATLTPNHLTRAHTLAQAFLAEGTDVLAGDALQRDADDLVNKSHEQAHGLRARLKKVMGVKSR